MTGLPDPLLFVGGTPRSGTTLLRNMLAAHPMIAVPDESYFIHDVHRELARRGALDDSLVAWRLVRDHRFFKLWNLDPAEVERVLDAHPPVSYSDVIRAAFAAFAASEGKPLSADKTPVHAGMFTWLAGLFPRSKFIHVLRDPRDVTMSLALQTWNIWGLPGAADAWVYHVRRARDAATALGNRFSEIRYEDLVARPQEELERLCEFAGVPFDRAMLAYGEQRAFLPDAHHVLSRQKPQRDARRWRQDMSTDDVALVELVCGKLMDVVGYERATRRATPGAVRSLVRHRASELSYWWIRDVAPVTGRQLRRVASRVAS